MAKSNARKNKSKKRSGKFTYQSRDSDDVKKRAAGGGNADYFLKDGITQWKPGEKNHIRILPPTWEDAKHYAYDTSVNYSIGPDNSVYLSLHYMKGEDDPIYEEMCKAISDGDEEYAATLKTTSRPCCWIIDRDNEDKGPQLWPMPWSLDRDIGSLMVDEDDGSIIAIDDPESGYDVHFTKKGKGLRTKYSAPKLSRKSSPIFKDEDELENVLDFLEDNPVSDVLQFFDYDTIEKALMGGSSKKKIKGKKEGSDYTWEQVHKMKSKKLENLIEEEGLDLNMDDFLDDDDCQNAICEELSIESPKMKSGKHDKKKMDKMLGGSKHDKKKRKRHGKK